MATVHHRCEKAECYHKKMQIKQQITMCTWQSSVMQLGTSPRARWKLKANSPTAAWEPGSATSDFLQIIKTDRLLWKRRVACKGAQRKAAGGGVAGNFCKARSFDPLAFPISTWLWTTKGEGRIGIIFFVVSKKSCFPNFKQLVCLKKKKTIVLSQKQWV